MYISDGTDAVSVMIGKAAYDLSFIPGLTIAPTAAIYKNDNRDDYYQFGLNVEAKVPLWDAVRVGAKIGYTPKRSNTFYSYSNYFYEGYGKINLESLLLHTVELDNLTLGAGLRQTEHKFYDTNGWYSGDYSTGETDGYISLSGAKGGFDGTITYTKSLHFSGDRGDISPNWLDVPGFTVVTGGYLNYALSASLGYTYKIVRPYVNYTYLSRYNITDTDFLAVGVTAKIGIVAVNAAVEWSNFSKKGNWDRNTYYTVNGGISF